MEQPDYYNKDGFSPIDSFKKGLMSEDIRGNKKKLL